MLVDQRTFEWYKEGWLNNSAFMLVVEDWVSHHEHPVFIGLESDPLVRIYNVGERGEILAIYSYDVPLELLCEQRRIMLKDIVDEPMQQMYAW